MENLSSIASLGEIFVTLWGSSYMRLRLSVFWLACHVGFPALSLLASVSASDSTPVPVITAH